MTDDEAQSARERLSREIGICLTSDLRAHIARGVVLVVASDIELLEAAVAFAEDDTACVKAWLTANKLVSPKATEVESWEKDPDARFRVAIVRPYVLVQPLIY